MANKRITELSRLYPGSVTNDDWLVCVNGSGASLETKKISFGDFYSSFSLPTNITFSNTHVSNIITTDNYGNSLEWNTAYQSVHLLTANTLSLLAGTSYGNRGAIIDNTFNSGINVTWHENVGKLKFEVVAGSSLSGDLDTSNNWVLNSGTNSGISLSPINSLSICPIGHGRSHFGVGSISGGYTHITDTALSVWGDAYISGGVTITQLGSGNAFTVEDSSNPDTTPFIIDKSGNVIIGKTTAATAKLDIVGGISATTIDLNQTTGTSPITVSSTTVVTNLNADLLDGKHASDFISASSPTFSGNISFPGTGKWTTDGKLGIGTLTPAYNLDVNGTIRGTVITSSVASGTAPLVVTSTNVVTNLNVDLLDGRHGDEFALISGPTFTGVPNAPTASAVSNSTQIATTAFTTTAVNNFNTTIQGNAPVNLNTLGKIASAINNDYLFFQTVNSSIATKIGGSSPTLTGNVTLPGGKWTSDGKLGIGTSSPVAPLDVVGQANFNNQITAISGTISSSTTTGTIVVTGGVGISGALYVGGNITGNVTGNVTGSAGSCSGNSATATTATACSGNSATATTANALNTANNYQVTNLTSSGRIYIANGTAGAPSIAFGSDGGTDTGLYWGGDGYINFTNNGVYSGQLTPSRNLVIVGTITGSNLSGTNTGDQTNIVGNAATATTATACSGNAATATTATACSGNSATATTATNLSGGSVSATTGTYSGSLSANAGIYEHQVNLSSGTNIDLSLGSVFTKTVSGSISLTVSNVSSSGTVSSFILDITNGGTNTVSWWSGLTWRSGTPPTLSTSGRDLLGFFTYNGGTTWNGIVMATEMA